MASGGDDKRVLCWQLDRAVTATIPGYQPAVEQYGKKQPVKRCSQNSMKEHYELREKESLHVFFRYIDLDPAIHMVDCNITLVLMFLIFRGPCEIGYSTVRPQERRSLRGSRD